MTDTCRHRLRYAWLVALMGLLPALPAAAQPAVPFHTLVVLPAVNASGDNKVTTWTLGWQYLIQERLRELPGISVPRLQNAPELVEGFRALKLDPSKLEVRQQVASALGADRLLALTITQGAPDWQISAELLDPANPTAPLATLPPALGQLSTVVTDTVVQNAVKALLNVSTVELTPMGRGEIPESAVQPFVWALWQWPFTRREDAARGELAKALPLLQRQQGSPLWLVNQQLAFALLASDKAQDAVGAVQRLANQRRNEARINLLNGQILAAAGQDTRAVDFLVQAANQSKGSLPAVEALASCYRRMGRVDEALGQYEAAARLWPRVRPFQINRGRIALEAAKYDVAVAAFREAIALQPSNPDGYLGMTRALLALNLPTEALGVASQLAALTPDDLEAKLLLAQAALGAGDAETARDAAAAAVSLKADDALAQRLLGQASYDLEDYPGAETALVAALKLDPKDATSAQTLGNTRLALGNLDGAAEVLTAALKTAPDTARPQLLLDLAAVELYRQKYDPALEAVRQAQALMPTDAESRYLESQVLLYKGDTAAGMTALEAALERDPAAAGYGQSVIAAYEAALENGGVEGLTLALGRLYEATGRNRDARRKYREYLTTAQGTDLEAFVRECIARVEEGGAG